MDLFSLGSPAFHNINHKLFDAYESATQESLKVAAQQSKVEEITPNTHSFRVSIDGSWQKNMVTLR